jgi:hypothetical protein
MKLRHLAITCGMVLLASGCRTGTSQSAGSGKPFLDEKKEVGPRLEWNREVTARSGGTISFRVTSQGPFAITVVTEKGYKALQGGDKKAFDKRDILLTVDSKEPSQEGKVTLPAGSSYFIIENQTDKKVELHLQCFPPG